MTKSPNKFVEGTFDFRKPLNSWTDDDTEFTCSLLGNTSIKTSVTISTIPADVAGTDEMLDAFTFPRMKVNLLFN